jgi:XTP/dITP diphosphohydrolase
VGGVAARLASGNAHKLEELRAALPGWQIDLLAADGYPPETGETYAENARGKAAFGRTLVDDGTWVLGEDSGIEVEGLDGGPGVRSARFAAGDEVGRLLEALGGVDGDGRRARYVCELVALGPGGAELRGRGTVEGRIADAASGREGFGYDPIFVPAGEERTVAELGNAWKLANSHRARAAAALADAFASR